jgi:hypothetical protein
MYTTMHFLCRAQFASTPTECQVKMRSICLSDTSMAILVTLQISHKKRRNQRGVQEKSKRMDSEGI